MDKAKEKLYYENLSDEEKAMYDRYQENRRIETSVEYTLKLEVREERDKEIAKNLMDIGLDDIAIAKATDLTVDQIEELRNKENT